MTTLASPPPPETESPAAAAGEARDRSTADDHAARLRALNARAAGVLARLHDEVPDAPGSATRADPGGAQVAAADPTPEPRVIGYFRGSPIYETTNASPPMPEPTLGRAQTYRGSPVGGAADEAPSGKRRWRGRR